MEIKLVMYSTVPWDNRLGNLVALLANHSEFLPDTWGITEKGRHPFDITDEANIEKLWIEKKGILFKKKKPRLWISVEWWPNAKSPGRFSMGITDNYFRDQEHVKYFLDFAKDIFRWGEMVYGFSCHREDYEHKNVLSQPSIINGKLVTTVEFNIQGCLPAIYWANFFGHRYVEWFSIDVLQSAPCYVETINDVGILLLSSASPLDFAEGTTRLTEGAMLDHIGRDSFFDKNNPTKPCKTPFNICSALI